MKNVDTPIHTRHSKPAAKYKAFPKAAALNPELVQAWLSSTQIEPVESLQYQNSPEWFLGPRIWGDSFWFLIEEGEAEAKVEDKTFALGPGDLMLVPRSVPHQMRLKSPGMKLTTVHFKAGLFHGVDLLSALGMPFHFPAGPLTPVLAALSADTARLFARRPSGWRLAFSANVTRGLLELIWSSDPPPLALSRGAAAARLDRLVPVMEWIERNLAKPDLKVESLAKTIHLSQGRLRSLFQQYLGTSPVRFLRKRRIERACEALRNTGRQVKEIAYQAGFNDVPFFFRVFKSHTGMTPQAYREQAWPRSSKARRN